MTHAYINYPRGRICIHRDSPCGDVQKGGKEGQRFIRVDIGNFSAEISKFHRSEHRFSSTHESNDMWLLLDLDDLEFELDVVRHVQRLLLSRYSVWRGAEVEVHCD